MLLFAAWDRRHSPGVVLQLAQVPDLQERGLGVGPGHLVPVVHALVAVDGGDLATPPAVRTGAPLHGPDRAAREEAHVPAFGVEGLGFEPAGTTRLYIHLNSKLLFFFFFLKQRLGTFCIVFNFTYTWESRKLQILLRMFAAGHTNILSFYSHFTLLNVFSNYFPNYFNC